MSYVSNARNMIVQTRPDSAYKRGTCSLLCGRPMLQRCQWSPRDSVPSVRCPRSPVLVLSAPSSFKGWNSTLCGSCWQLTYGGNSIYITAIGTISDGLDISLKAMNILTTNGKAQQLGVVNAQATQADRWHCGL